MNRAATTKWAGARQAARDLTLLQAATAYFKVDRAPLRRDVKRTIVGAAIGVRGALFLHEVIPLALRRAFASPPLRHQMHEK